MSIRSYSLFCRLQSQLSPPLESLLLSQNLKSFSHQKSFQPLCPARHISRMPNPRNQKGPHHGFRGWEGVVEGNLATVTVTGIRMRLTPSTYHRTTPGLMRTRRSGAWRQRKPRARNIGDRQQRKLGKGDSRSMRKLKNNYVKEVNSCLHLTSFFPLQLGWWMIVRQSICCSLRRASP